MESKEKIAVVPEEAAEMCTVGIGVILDWVKNETSFPAIKIGRKTIIPVDGLRKWIEARGALRIGLKTHSSQVADIVISNRRRREA